jgi:hypothetical protein
MTTAPKRRWPRFTLWTLFLVVIVAACWVGYELLWVHQRQNMTARHVARVGGESSHVGVVEYYGTAPTAIPTAVRILSIFGENPRQGQLLIFYDGGSGELSTDDKQELEDARVLFPESQIMWKLVKAH